MTWEVIVAITLMILFAVIMHLVLPKTPGGR
jgi:hypothetical protein